MKVRLTEAQYKALEKFIEEARAAEAPVSLKNLFNDNPEAKYFTVVQRLKGGSDDEYSFQFVEQDGHKGIKDVNKMGKTKGCKIDFNPDTMIYGNTFSVSFGSCGTRTINNVIAVKVYADENSLKNGHEMDSMEVEHEMDETPEGLANKYYEILKNVGIDQEIYIDSKNKWDGVVITKRNDSVNIKIYKHGIPINEADDNSEMEWNVTQPQEPQQQQKAKPTRKSIILTLDITTNPFYVENGKLMLKGISYDSTTEKKSEFVVPVKKFSTNAGDLKIPRPDKSEKQKPEIDNPKDVESEEELRKQAMEAYKMILGDKTLQKVFYKKPSFWNLFVSELKGKKAPGKHIVPTLQLLNSYGAENLNKELGAEFIQGKSVNFEPYNTPYSIDIDGGKFQLSTGIPRRGVVRKFKFDKKYYIIDSKETNGSGVKIIVKSSTDVENVFKCELIRYIRDSQNQIRDYKYNGDTYFKFDASSGDGYRPIPKNERKPVE
jgi:hypothetical protein